MAVQDRSQVSTAAASTATLTQNDALTYDDDGIPYVNPNTPGADIATGDKQTQIINALAQLLASSIITTGNVGSVGSIGGTVSVLPLALAPNEAIEVAGNLQRIADGLEQMNQELRVVSALIAQLGQPLQDGPDQLRADMTLQN